METKGSKTISSFICSLKRASILPLTKHSYFATFFESFEVEEYLSPLCIPAAAKSY